MKKYLLLLWLSCSCSLLSAAQGMNNLWLLGYDSIYQVQTGRVVFDFASGTRNMSYTTFPMNLKDVAANITDKNGQLLFYTNGVYVADRTHTAMPNGAGLSPGWYSTNLTTYNNGSLLSQAALIVPKPADSTKYYIIHTTLQGPPVYSGQHLYVSTVDMSLRAGLGDVVNKNQVLLQTDLTPTRLAAVKHANGRDWWVIAQEHATNTFFRLLITPDSISGPFSQSIGTVRGQDEGGAYFSPDGSRYASFDRESGLDIYDFDRCTGLLSNHIFVDILDNTGDSGLAFSPNSQVLYVSQIYKVYQINLAAGSPAAVVASKQTVATWDGFHDPAGPLFSTLFMKAELAPDGKIYITTGNGTMFLHEIHQPNNLGLACNLTQHSLQLPVYYCNSLPNHPNYHLGALAGSPCDTLTNSVAEQVKQVPVQLYPNPNSGEFSLSFAPQPEQGELQVYDVLGKLVHQEAIAEWSQLKRVSLPRLTQGVYHSRLVWKGKTGVIRFVKE